MEKPGCFVFGKCGKNILQDRDFFQYCQNYLENTYIGKGTKSKNPDASFRNFECLCNAILNNEPTINNQTERWFRS
jgi:hypothetical protein